MEGSSQKWSWRDSNPRPNEEAISFLHAYPQTWFSNKHRIRATNVYLSSCYLTETPELRFCQPRFACTACSDRFVATASGRCLVPMPGIGIKRLTYCNSVTQQERNYFRQLWFDHYFKGSITKTLHAYLSLLPAVKTNQPR